MELTATLHLLVKNIYFERNHSNFKLKVPNDDNTMGPILKVLPNGTQKLNIFQNNLTLQDCSPVLNIDVFVIIVFIFFFFN